MADAGKLKEADVTLLVAYRQQPRRRRQLQVRWKKM